MTTKANKKQKKEDYHIACQNCGKAGPLHIIPLRNEFHVVGLIYSCDNCDAELMGKQFDRQEKFNQKK